MRIFSRKKNIDTDELLKEKKYLLIDFWGTWCAPCKELTPDLIELNKKHSSKLNILSFAYDQDIDDVKDYINKNKLNWSHSFIQGNAKDENSNPEIINNLRVTAYPTFISINSEGIIVARGSGKTILEKIKKILND